MVFVSVYFSFEDQINLPPTVNWFYCEGNKRIPVG